MTPLRMRHGALVATTFVAATFFVPTTGASARPTTGTHCRHQSFSWTRSKSPALNSTKGPRVRTHPTGSVSLTDNLVTAQFETTGQIPTKYVDVTGNSVQPGEQLTHLTSVTVVSTKGKSKTYKVGSGTTGGFVYSRDMIKNYEQVELPVNGKSGDGRKTPKLKKVVVTAIENCYASN